MIHSVPIHTTCVRSLFNSSLCCSGGRGFPLLAMGFTCGSRGTMRVFGNGSRISDTNDFFALQAAYPTVVLIDCFVFLLQGFILVYCKG